MVFPDDVPTKVATLSASGRKVRVTFAPFALPLAMGTVDEVPTGSHSARGGGFMTVKTPVPERFMPVCVKSSVSAKSQMQSIVGS